jgi:hypothetical protein
MPSPSPSSVAVITHGYSAATLRVRLAGRVSVLRTEKFNKFINKIKIKILFI